MRKESVQFLEDLLNTPSPSAYEEKAQRLWCRYVSKFTDAVEIDVHGNAIANINGKGKPRIMLAGHIDEIGLMINHISDDGFLHFKSIGGVRTTVLSGQWVKILHGDNEVRGVVGKNLFWAEGEKNKSLPKITDMTIDIGAKDKKTALKMVSPGDPVVIDNKPGYLSKDLLAARGLDDRIGAFIVAEVMRNLSGKKIDAGVFGVSTVQEEVGCRGAITSSYTIEPDAAVAIDVTPATDCPQMDKRELSDISLGKGLVISRGAPANRILENGLKATADKAKIKYQLEAAPNYSATDADSIQVSRHGVATETISVPCRYLHTPTEVVSLKDVESIIKLLTLYISGLKKTQKYAIDWKK